MLENRTHGFLYISLQLHDSTVYLLASSAVCWFHSQIMTMKEQRNWCIWDRSA